MNPLANPPKTAEKPKHDEAADKPEAETLGKHEAQPIGILYHGPASHQALDLLAEMLGPEARRMGHAVVSPTETLYMARVTSVQAREGIAAKLKAGKYPQYFDLAKKTPTADQLAGAAATVGTLPVLG